MGKNPDNNSQVSGEFEAGVPITDRYAGERRAGPAIRRPTSRRY